VTSPGIRSPVAPRRTLLGVRDRGDRGFAEPELSFASFGPRRGRQCVLEGSRAPRRIPRVEEFDDALDVPEGFPIKTTALTPAGCGVASTAPTPVPELVWRVCTTSLLAVASSPRWLSWGSCSVPLGIAASGSDTPSTLKTVAFRLQGPRPVLTATGQWEPHWRRQQSPFPSFHQVRSEVPVSRSLPSWGCHCWPPGHPCSPSGPCSPASWPVGRLDVVVRWLA
jgi:hypothetical protein